MIALAMAWFDMTLVEAQRCTLNEFAIYSKARMIKRQGEIELIAIQAWMNQQAKATKTVGKKTRSVYKNFSDFYDSEKEFYYLFNDRPSKKRSMLAEMNKKIGRR